MQAVKYREILNAVAYKLGYDPLDPNFPRDEAQGIGTYIDQWVTRLYPSKDWPEWTRVHRFQPDANHIVTWSALSPDTAIPPHITLSTLTMWRVLAVYIVDPRLVYGANSTKFYLREEGIHCGFEHGVNVWIKYIDPPPRFTSVEWDAITVYNKDEVVYLPTNGNVFKSKTSQNRGHDPSFWFSPAPPPGVDTNDTNPSPFLSTTVLQQKTVSQFGVAEQDKIMKVFVNRFATPSTVSIPDPPAASASFRINVLDSTGTITGTALSVADGVITLAGIATDLATTLGVALGVGWTVTADTTELSVSIQNASDFQLASIQTGTDWPVYFATVATPPAPLQYVQVQAYVAAVSNAVITPQITKTTFSGEQLVAGALYSFAFKDLSGTEHLLEYQSLTGDGQDQIMAGVLASLTSTALQDNYFEKVLVSADDTPSLTFTTEDHASVDATIILPGSPWWEVVPFPLALSEQVIRGAYADALKDWGQADKSAMEEQAVGTESDAAAEKFTYSPTLPLTGQASARSRYR